MCSHSLSGGVQLWGGGAAHWGGAQILASALGGRPDVAPHTVQMWSTVAGQRPDAALLGMRGAALRLQGATSRGGGGVTPRGHRHEGQEGRGVTPTHPCRFGGALP